MPELLRPESAPESANADDLTVTRTVSVRTPNWLDKVDDAELVTCIALLKEEVRVLEKDSGRRPEILTYLDDLINGTVPDLGSTEALEERYRVKSPRTLVNWRNRLSEILRDLIDSSLPPGEETR